MSHKCPTYGTSVEELFCSRRHKKAIDNPNDEALAACRTCVIGIAAYKSTGEAPAVKQSPSFNRAKPRKTDVGPKKEKTVSKSICTTPGCGKGLQKEGLCYACYKKKHGKAPYAPRRKEALGRKNKTCPECQTEATSNVQSTCQKCGYVYFKKPATQSKAKMIEADHNIRVGLKSTPILQKQDQPKPVVLLKEKNNGAALGQLLYASDLLDGQINTAIESGQVDTTILIDIRSRIGVILRASLPVTEIMNHVN